MLMQSTKTKIVAFLIILLSIIVSLLMWENINFLPSEEAIKNFEGTVYIKNNYSTFSAEDRVKLMNDWTNTKLHTYLEYKYDLS